MKKIPLLGIAIAILFIMLGVYLTSKENQLAVIIGYANIVFFSGLIIFAILKLLSNRTRT
ncbi:hypothetical protein OX283_010310 [Flavobacterium sp. SUN052]|uniref:hypothetical protein n=1 Tax=Flavobacterium sp. SUN052 TaxID=3002441 RepID=UPI00237D52C0|nr:hypothetical protein [Flavobacterium sp. SUN052]MEC4005051.1 hypothetical protein [Flavobacterium sp. SUN052]